MVAAELKEVLFFPGIYRVMVGAEESVVLAKPLPTVFPHQQRNQLPRASNSLTSFASNDGPVAVDRVETQAEAIGYLATRPGAFVPEFSEEHLFHHPLPPSRHMAPGLWPP